MGAVGSAAGCVHGDPQGRGEPLEGGGVPAWGPTGKGKPSGRTGCLRGNPQGSGEPLAGAGCCRARGPTGKRGAVRVGPGASMRGDHPRAPGRWPPVHSARPLTCEAVSAPTRSCLGDAAGASPHSLLLLIAPGVNAGRIPGLRSRSPGALARNHNWKLAGGFLGILSVPSPQNSGIPYGSESLPVPRNTVKTLHPSYRYRLLRRGVVWRRESCGDFGVWVLLVPSSCSENVSACPMPFSA